MVSALYADRAVEGGLTTEALLTELASTQPLSAIMDSQIQALRLWAQDRTVPAHALDPAEPSVQLST